VSLARSRAASAPSVALKRDTAPLFRHRTPSLRTRTTMMTTSASAMTPLTESTTSKHPRSLACALQRGVSVVTSVAPWPSTGSGLGSIWGSRRGCIGYSFP
jgi:hypothetical protein